ncbi:hypothetical protein CPI84_01100 [Erwinia pyrifoliae]|nr:hypothetical protein CPI84_01100 [Erwinia pyrifoliae]
MEKTKEKMAELARLINEHFKDKSQRARLITLQNEYNQNLVMGLESKWAKLNESNEKLPRSAERDAFPSTLST